MARLHPYFRIFINWLRANPLGPALTVAISGLISVFVLPQFTLSLFSAPKLLLAQVLLSALAVPVAVFYIHETPWKPLAYIWGGIYAIALLSKVTQLRTMSALDISAHMTFWFLIGFVLTALFALYRRKEIEHARGHVIQTNLLSSAPNRAKLHAQ